MKRNLSITLPLLILLISASGQTPTVFMTDGAEWGKARWSDGKPGAESVAIITNGRTAVHSEGTTPLHTLRIGNNDAGGMLQIRGGFLDIATAIQLGTNGGGRSAVVQRGGAVRVNRVMLASNHSADAFAAYGIAAGSLEFNHMDVGTVGSGVFSVLGSAPERVRGINIFLRGGVNSGLEFILDAEGVRTIELSGRLEIGESLSIPAIRVDGSRFPARDAELLLIDARSISGQFDPEKIVFTNFPEGVEPSLEVVRNQLLLRVRAP